MWTLAKSQDDEGHDNSPVVVFDKGGNLIATSGSYTSVYGGKIFFGVFEDKGVLIYKSWYDGRYYLVAYSLNKS